jgi:hypothetical protein
MTDHEIALRAALNLLRDSIESGRMPSGLPLQPGARDVHERAAAHFEELLRKVGQPTPAEHLLDDDLIIAPEALLEELTAYEERQARTVRGTSSKAVKTKRK